MSLQLASEHGGPAGDFPGGLNYGDRRAQASPGAGSGPHNLLARLTARRGRLNTRALAVTIRHLETLLRAGLPLAKALQTVAKQSDNSRLRTVMADIANEVASGQMLSLAMATRGGLFDSLTINVIRAGEASGKLPETLAKLALDLQKRDTLRRTVVGAMIYPAIVIVIAMGVVGFLMAFVMPTFEDLFTKMKLDLPLVTRALLCISRATVHYWWAVLAAVVTPCVAWRPLMRHDTFRSHWDRMMLRLPMLGAIRRKALASRFLGAFAILVGSGVSIVEALRLMVELADNSEARAAVNALRRHVSRGGKMSEPMEQYSQIFTPMAIQMISVGEQTGSLPEASAHTAAFLAEDVEARVKALTAVMEPMLTVGLGITVGTIAMAIYLPMFDLMKAIGH
jgi:type II secretory pathway component PulF